VRLIWLRIAAAAVLTFGVAASASAQSKENAIEGIKAFVEACIRTTPDFRNSAAAFKRRSLPVVSLSDLQKGRVSKSAPALLAILGPAPEIKNGKACAVVFLGNHDKMAAATVEKYIAEPSFPHTARIDGGTRVGPGLSASVFAVFPHGRNNIYALVVSRGLSFQGYGRATMMMAMSGKIDLQ
jgi:hypothetical protein